ncbi:hypothetical protein Pelo_18625 [Pelomyxa schiedti]|nr:hypothetical protein Pelo_18625 [Pelomyxa schiedti]
MKQSTLPRTLLIFSMLHPAMSFAKKDTKKHLETVPHNEIAHPPVPHYKENVCGWLIAQKKLSLFKNGGKSLLVVALS